MRACLLRFLHAAAPSPPFSPFLPNHHRCKTQVLEKILVDPAIQRMIYPYLPEPMRNPETFKAMLQVTCRPGCCCMLAACSLPCSLPCSLLLARARCDRCQLGWFRPSPSSVVSPPPQMPAYRAQLEGMLKQMGGSGGFTPEMLDMMKK